MSAVEQQKWRPHQILLDTSVLWSCKVVVIVRKTDYQGAYVVERRQPKIGGLQVASLWVNGVVQSKIHCGYKNIALYTSILHSMVRKHSELVQTCIFNV